LELIASRPYRGATGYLRKINPETNRPYSDFTLVKENLQEPFPENIQITPPDTSLPDRIKGFAGLREGKWADMQKTAVLVKRISLTEADIVLSLGFSGKIPKGCVKIPAQVVDGGPPEIFYNSNFEKLCLTAGTTGYTMKGWTVNRRNAFSSAFLRKYKVDEKWIGK
jgi:hypothetical protein